jgi:Tfp pilus assembly protein PilE
MQGHFSPRPFLSSTRKNFGFTLAEVVVGGALFALIAVAVYQGYATLIKLVAASRTKITATDLANEQLELIRNMPYANVGEVSGIPNGVIVSNQTFVRDGNTFTVNTTVRNVDDPFDGTIGGTPNDTSPADYKLVELNIDCSNCRNFQTMTVDTRVAPKNLETASTNGALFVKVFDGNGQPVSNAQVHIVNSQITPNIIIDDVTPTSGILQIVDVPPGVNAYQITVTKAGYTTDQTTATSTGNPNPTKPNATVVVQQVTQISLTIDKVSTFNISTVTDTCAPVPNVPFSIIGAKLIGSTPDVYKYSQNFTTNGSGLKTLSNMEWDTYTIALTGGTLYLAGVNPLMPVTLLPNASQDVQFVVTTKPTKLLLVTVKDSGTGLPVSGANVTLSDGGSFSTSLVTGRGYLSQSDWSGGPGQTDFTDPTMYLSSDGNIDTHTPNGEMKLNPTFGIYAPTGVLTSSTFDTGTTSNFNQINWAPTNQPVQTGANNVQFQIATNATNNGGETWNFFGPDGTNATYYSVSNTNIASVHNGDRYFRYKAYFATASTTFTPNIADVSLTFTSSCLPPGQVIFSNLDSGPYTITVDKTGYSQSQVPVTISSAWQQAQVLIGP